MISPEIVSLIIAGGAVIAMGFFAGIETGFISVNRLSARHAAHSGSKRAKSLDSLLQKTNLVVSTTLVGTNLAHVAAVSMATAAVLTLMPRYGNLVSTLGMTTVVLIFAEIIPKSVFRAKPNRLLYRYSALLQFFYYLFYPITWLVGIMCRGVLALLRVRPNERMTFVTRDEMKLLLKDTKKDTIKEGERRMLSRLVDFAETQARDVMLPLVDVSAVDIDDPLSDVLDIVNEEKFSRIPVYEDNSSDIIGVVMAKDLLEANKPDEPVRNYLRDIGYVPESMGLDEVLAKLRRGRRGIVAVVDEYGGCIGIVTMEDVLEEIVGDIQDEHDEESPLVTKVSQNEYVMSARTPLDLLQDEYDINLPESDAYETVGGLILELAERIPRQGEVIKQDGYEFKVIEANRRGVIKVKLTLGKGFFV